MTKYFIETTDGMKYEVLPGGETKLSDSYPSIWIPCKVPRTMKYDAVNVNKRHVLAVYMVVEDTESNTDTETGTDTDTDTEPKQKEV